MAHQLLINEPPLQVLPSLALKIGLNEAIVLQQIHYWLNPNFNTHFIEDRYWVYNSCEGWRAQFKFWSKDTIRRTVVSLQRQGLLLVGDFNRNKFNRSKWYSIDYKRLQALEDCIEASPQKADVDECSLHTSTDAVCVNRSGQNGDVDECNLHTSIDARRLHGHRQDAPIDDGAMHKSLTETTSRDYTETNTHRGEAREGQPGVFRREQPCGQPRPQHPSQRPAMMLALWNGSVRKMEQPLELTAERKSRLARCLADAFEDDLDGWRDYCDQISCSPFLMGKGERGWKITLNWALDAKRVRKILDGDFQPQSSPGRACPGEDAALKVKDEPALDLSQTHPLWAQVCKHLIESVGVGFFNSWMAQLVPEGLDGEHPVLRAPNRFVRDIVDQRYKSRIEGVMKAFDPTIKTVSIGTISIDVAVPTDPQHQQRG